MIEDEAFIRTIVDSPGDDLPRLVYADWLDERNDPRGAYLRAESEWAKAKQTAGFIVLRLNGLAEGLDPVWVARISRPPVGVCCDHLQLSHRGQPVPPAEIAKREEEAADRDRKYGGHAVPLFQGFPNDYKAFVLNYNGGDTGHLSFPVPGVGLVRPFTAQVKLRFSAFGEQMPIEDPTGPWGLWLFLARTIGSTETSPRPDELILRLDREHSGRVYYQSDLQHDWSAGEFPEVATSLAQFFYLTQPLTKPI